MNLLISGPCGVGKSTVSRILAEITKKSYKDFDKIGIDDMEKRKPGISPFSIAGLNLLKCMPIIFESTSDEIGVTPEN